MKTLPGRPYRPTLARIRKSIFDTLGNLLDRQVLDLFAGAGSLGFEAASRGAGRVVFVESSRRACRILHENASRFPDTRFEVVNADAYRYLETCPRYDLICADPPYGQVDLDRLVTACRSRLSENGFFVLESGKNDYSGSGYWKSSHFGDTGITYWRNQG